MSNSRFLSIESMDSVCLKMPCLLGMILCCLVIFEGSAAAFMKVPENEIVFLNSAAVLQCSTNSTKLISWFFDSAKSFGTNAVVLLGNLTTSKYKLDRSIPGQYNLIIESADLSHAGTYKCSEGAFGPKVEAKLAVIDPEVLCQVNSSAALAENDYLWMQCILSYSGETNINMTWIRNSSGSDIQHTFIYNLRNQSVIVIQVESSDDGEAFAFKAIFEQESNSRQTIITWNYRANVLYAPKNLLVTPVKTIYGVGDRIKCSADGNPIPSYEWTDVGTNRTIDGPVLSIDASVQPDRNHSFKCTAYNNVTGSRKHVSETVIFSVTKTTDSSSSSHGASMILVVTVILICVAILIATSVFFRATVKAWTMKHSSRIAHRVPDVVRSDLVIHDNDYCEIGDLTHEGTTALTSMPRDDRLNSQVEPGFSMYDLVREEDNASTITHQGSNISEPLSPTRTDLAANQTSYFGADGTEYARVNLFQQERQVPMTPKPPMFRKVDNYSKIDHTQRAPPPLPRL